MIGLIAVTAAGRGAAERLERAWPGETRGYPGPAAEALPQAWAECDALVCFLATGATIRLIAPLLAGKRTDPAVVCVDEASRHAIALLGGHGAVGGRPGRSAGPGRTCWRPGSRRCWARSRCSARQPTRPGCPGLDTLGWPVEGRGRRGQPGHAGRRPGPAGQRRYLAAARLPAQRPPRPESQRRP